MTFLPKPPPIFVSTHDRDRLRALALDEAGSLAAKFLLSELDRADVRTPNTLPSRVVRMNSRVTYRVDGTEWPETRYLVYPDDLSIYGGQISVMTPLGAALIGLSVGDRIFYPTPANRVHEVKVDRVSFQSGAKILPFCILRRPRLSNGEDPGPGAA